MLQRLGIWPGLYTLAVVTSVQFVWRHSLPHVKRSLVAMFFVRVTAFVIMYYGNVTPMLMRTMMIMSYTTKISTTMSWMLSRI